MAGDHFLENRIKEQQAREASGPVISFRLLSKDDADASRIASELGITKPQLAKAALLAALDGYRQEADSE